AKSDEGHRGTSVRRRFLRRTAGLRCHDCTVNPPGRRAAPSARRTVMQQRPAPWAGVAWLGCLVLGACGGGSGHPARDAVVGEPDAGSRADAPVEDAGAAEVPPADSEPRDVAPAEAAAP